MTDNDTALLYEQVIAVFPFIRKIHYSSVDKKQLNIKPVSLQNFQFLTLANFVPMTCGDAL